MRSLTNKEAVTCPKCGRRFESIKVTEIPNCFYCELKRYPHSDDPDYRDVAAARVSSGTYTEEQKDIYWEGVCKGDSMPQFPGFPEEFDVPRKEMKIELVPLTVFQWPGTIEELEESLKECVKDSLSVSTVRYSREEDIFTLMVPDFTENPTLNLKYTQRFFATFAEDLAEKLGKEMKFRIHFPEYPQWDFTAAG